MKVQALRNTQKDSNPNNWGAQRCAYGWGRSHLTLTISGSISPLQLSKYFFRSWSQYSNTSVSFLSLCNTSWSLEKEIKSFGILMNPTRGNKKRRCSPLLVIRQAQTCAICDTERSFFETTAEMKHDSHIPDDIFVFELLQKAYFSQSRTGNTL